MISQATTLALVAAFGAAMFATSAVRRKSANMDRFLVAGRSVGTATGALSVASTWIWAPALFLAAQKAYQQGLPGLLWFTVPNVGCLVLFAFVARRIRQVFPRGYTLPEYIAHRFDARTHLIYLFCFLSLQVCSLAVQLIAGAAMLDAMSGIPYVWGVLLLVVMFTSYSLLEGLSSSIRTDLVQMLVMGAGMAAVVAPAVAKAGGPEALAAGLAGFNGAYGNPLDLHVAYTFGITVTIGLMSGPVGDQQHWQRAFAFAEGKVFKGYVLGAFIFALVPLTMGLLGFVAAGLPEAAPDVRSGAVSAQQVGPEVIRALLPSWATMVFMVMILSGLASTGDSALCAGGGLAAVDIYQRYLRPETARDDMVRVSRAAMLILAVLATGIALVPGITILSLFLFYGTLRSSTFLPTLLLLYREDATAAGIFRGVAAAVVFGLPVYLAGELAGNVHLKVAANVGILILSLACPLWAMRKGRNKKTV